MAALTQNGDAFEPIRPAPPITTIFIAGASDRKPRKKNSQMGIPARLAQNGVCDRDNHVRKSRSQCTDPDAGHSRDDRGRDDGAHRDADAPKAIGITLIDTVRDQHHS